MHSSKDVHVRHQFLTQSSRSLKRHHWFRASLALLLRLHPFGTPAEIFYRITPGSMPASLIIALHEFLKPGWARSFSEQGRYFNCDVFSGRIHVEPSGNV